MDTYFVRSERAEDIPAISEVHLQAFGQDGEARLVNALRHDGNINPELSLVAVHGDRIVGHILFSPVTIVSDTVETPALALAPLSVHQDYQGRGVGASLIEVGIGECRRLGYRIVIVVGHPGYYPRFGFTPARDQGIFAPFPCPDNAFMALSLAAGALKGVGGVVRYPCAFDTVGAHTS